MQSFAGMHFTTGGALNSMAASKLELSNEEYTLVTLPNNTKVIFKINQAFLYRDSNQTEALLRPHQDRAVGSIVDDCAKRQLATSGKPGGQCLQVGVKKFEMQFHGWKCYFKIRKPKEADLAKYDKCELSSSLNCNPQRRYLRRSQIYSNLDICKWHSKLSFPTFEVAKFTLANTSQLVQKLESETKEYIQDHYKIRVWAPRPHRINDVLYTDTFFSSVPSIRGYKCF